MIDRLQFNNPNNSCASLRLLAELVRRQDIHLEQVAATLLGASGEFAISIKGRTSVKPKAPRPTDSNRGKETKT